MLVFTCDWCSMTKRPEETWILGMAAETVGLTAARREVNILSGWDRERAVLPLAVHFCSPECKDRYLARVFDVRTGAEEVVVETGVPEEVTIERTLPEEERVVTKIKLRKPRQRKRAA